MTHVTFGTNEAKPQRVQYHHQSSVFIMLNYMGHSLFKCYWYCYCGTVSGAASDNKEQFEANATVIRSRAGVEILVNEV